MFAKKARLKPLRTRMHLHWVSAALLLFILPTQAHAYRLAHVAGQVELKDSADAASASKGQLAQGTLVNTADAPKNGYYLVRSSKAFGWVRASDLVFKPESTSGVRAPARAATPAGAIVTVQGTVNVVAGGLGAKRVARSGDVINVHDFIETDGGGGAKLLLKDHSVVDLGPSTQFMIDEYLENNGTDREVQLSMTARSAARWSKKSRAAASSISKLRQRPWACVGRSSSATCHPTNRDKPRSPLKSRCSKAWSKSSRRRLSLRSRVRARAPLRLLRRSR